VGALIRKTVASRLSDTRLSLQTPIGSPFKKAPLRSAPKTAHTDWIEHHPGAHSLSRRRRWNGKKRKLGA